MEMLDSSRSPAPLTPTEIAGSKWNRGLLRVAAAEAGHEGASDRTEDGAE